MVHLNVKAGIEVVTRQEWTGIYRKSTTEIDTNPVLKMTLQTLVFSVMLIDVRIMSQFLVNRGIRQRKKNVNILHESMVTMSSYAPSFPIRPPRVAVARHFSFSWEKSSPSPMVRHHSASL
jgi:hypothetical protein